jgi:ketosteroid isomerase-like protein
MSDLSSLDNDLRAIEAINQRDVEAALARDTATMMSQWTDDFVLLQPAGPILRGRSMIAEAFRGAESSVVIVENLLDIQEVMVLGDHAFHKRVLESAPRWGAPPIRGKDGVHPRHRLPCRTDLSACRCG